ncbi:hypothetical protein B0H10DRAFT_1950029 [Mycena sp. CBHHK59/15]|nr:hypothetical protein B0H10DRAFT_1950029 [Mycena sp. CBHHK59/15]
MPLQDIVEDILLKILSFCDVHAVLSASTVNKSLRRVALTKQLWLYLLQDVASRGLLDSPSEAELDASSTDDIIQEIKRVVCGPATWAPASFSAPQICREVTFRVDMSRDTFFSPQLIPGGTHAMLKNLEGVHLYDVRTGRRVWTTVSKTASNATGLVDAGNTVRILLVPLEYSENA